MKYVSFAVDGQKLDGSLFFPETIKSKNPAIIFLHGWASNKERYAPFAEMLTSFGYICLTVSLRGHGNSEGDSKKLTRVDFFQDALAVYDVLSALPEVNKKQISLVGASFGAYMAVLVTQERPIANLVLRVPANYADSNFDKPQFNFSSEVDKGIYLRSQPELHKGTRVLRALQEFGGNVLIVESGNDAIIPHEMIEDYKRAVTDKSKLTHIVMEGASHPLNDEDRKKFGKILTDWFKNKV